MKRILCFGDSNTWGFVPAKETRYPADVRWTGVAQKELGSDYLLIDEALNGRTTVWEDPVRPYMNAFTYLGPCLLSQFPLDGMTIMLGTNDRKQRFHLNAWAIAEGVKCIIEEAQKCSREFNGFVPEILVISPPYIHDNIDNSPYGAEFEGERTLQVSHALAPEIERVAKDHGCHFFDASIGEVSPLDSIHLTPEGHRVLGLAIAAKLKEIVK